MKETTKAIKRHPELFGCALALIAAIHFVLLLSFQEHSHSTNLLGILGHVVALFWYHTVGIAAPLVFLGMSWFGLQLILGREVNYKKVLAATIALLSFCLILEIDAYLLPSFQTLFARLLGFDVLSSFHLGGWPAHILFQKLPFFKLESLLSVTGTFLLALSCMAISLGYLFEVKLQNIIEWTRKKVEEKREEKPAKPTWRGYDEKNIEPKKEVKRQQSTRLPSLLAESRETPAVEPIDGILELAEKKENVVRNIDLGYAPKREPKKLAALPLVTTIATNNSSYKIPSPDLFQTAKKTENATLKKELEQKADLLEETLLSFGIEAKVGQIHTGPTITCFEVHPAIGVKVGRITALDHDIALNLEAKSLRIIAPIPGKAAVGIEVPNKKPEEVSFKELLLNYLSPESKKFHIPMLLGKAVNGDIVMQDLAKMPHCIIAGATGSGKSVCINSIVMSILLTQSPDDVRLLMIDPKKVELTPYSKLPHMLSPVITEPKEATAALNWLVREMEKRYDILKLTGHRNIDSFNKRKRDEAFEKSIEIEIPEKMAYYVGIVDELADLMMVASSDIETPIARIAQMARAVGIHLILATQRPSREVITGLIKANFPARIAFKVASRVNSQIVLDETGAETLLGNGDMLFLAPGSSNLMRAQGVFVRDEEIQKVVEEITRQSGPQYIIPSFDRLSTADLGFTDPEEPGDDLYEEAKSIVFSTGNASTTFLQRKLKIGYARAASLMDELERKGVVGPQEGAKPRKIFFPAGVKAAAGEAEELEE